MSQLHLSLLLRRRIAEYTNATHAMALLGTMRTEDAEDTVMIFTESRIALDRAIRAAIDKAGIDALKGQDNE